MPLSVQTGQTHNVSYLSINPSVRYQTCDMIFVNDEPIMLQIGTSGPWGKGIKR